MAWHGLAATRSQTTRASPPAGSRRASGANQVARPPAGRAGVRMRCPAHAGQTQSGPPRPADMRRAGRPGRARGEALTLLHEGRGNGGRRPPARAAWRQAGDLRCVCVAGGGAQVVVAGVVVYALRQHVACLLAACLPACFACCCLSALSLTLQRCAALPRSLRCPSLSCGRAAGVVVGPRPGWRHDALSLTDCCAHACLATDLPSV